MGSLGSLSRAVQFELKNQEKQGGTVAEWLPWTAASRPQEMLLETPAQIIGYGGSVGGGKTSGILIKAISKHRRSLILRRTYPRLKDIIERSKVLMLGSGASYNSTDKFWHNIPNGKTIEFGHCQHEDSKQNYHGQEHDLKAFDEATEFSRSQVDYISGWNRSTFNDQICQILLTFNPPLNRDGRWVIKYFGPWIDPDYKGIRAAPGEIRWFVVDTQEDGSALDIELESVELFIKTDCGEDVTVNNPEPVAINGKFYVPKAREVEYKGDMLTPRSRTFIRATLEDNPYLRDTGYKGVVQSFPEPMRSALLKGVYAIAAKDDPFQIIPSEWVRVAMKRWQSSPPDEAIQKRVAADVAWGGSDRCAIACLYDNWVSSFTILTGSDLKESESLIKGDKIATTISNLMDHDKVEVVLDVGGVGASPYDSCRRMGLRPIGVYFGGASKDRLGQKVTDRTGNLWFLNKRAEMYWTIREALDPLSGLNLALPPDEELEEELCSHRWESTGKIGNILEIKVNSKDDIREMINRSPDKSDTLALLLAKHLYAPTFDWSKFSR